jgi:molybdopterin-guanine dinucleotide biosynthesis protein A
MTETLANVSGFVLAGGESLRMGRDKALLELAAVPMIVRASRLVESVVGTAVVIGRAEPYQSLGLQIIADDWPGAGPLGGIATALRASSAAWSLVVACDLPYLTKDWLDYVVRRAISSAADAVLPMNVRGAEPLCAMYHKRCEDAIRGALERGIRKTTDGLASLRIEPVEPADWKAFDREGLLFKNMNSPEDYEQAKAKLG